MARTRRQSRICLLAVLSEGSVSSQPAKPSRIRHANQLSARQVSRSSRIAVTTNARDIGDTSTAAAMFWNKKIPALGVPGSATLIQLVSRGRTLRQLCANQHAIRRCDQSFFQLRQPHALDVPSKPQLLQRPDAIPVYVDFIPGESMLRGGRMRVMVVVPALAESQQRHPPAVGGKITSGEAASAPGVRGRIDQPGGVQANHGAHENAPQQEWKSADGEQNHAQHDHWDVVIFRDPDVKLVFGEVGNVSGQRRGVVVHRLAHQNPSHVRPPLAVDRRVRVAILVGILMMNAVGRHPENRPALERQRGADSQEILDPLRSLVAAVREQAVVAHPDAEASRHPPEKHGYEESFPGEEKESRYGAYVKGRHENCRDPVDFVVRRLPLFQAFQLHVVHRPVWLVLTQVLLGLPYQEGTVCHCNTCVIAAFRRYRSLPGIRRWADRKGELNDVELWADSLGQDTGRSKPSPTSCTFRGLRHSVLQDTSATPPRSRGLTCSKPAWNS